MSKGFYRGIRCRECGALFLDWRDHWRHLRRHRREKKQRT
jgi:hypothetical protein